MTISYLLGQPWLFWYYLTFGHPLSILEYWQKQVNTKSNGGGCVVFQATLQVKASKSTVHSYAQSASRFRCSTHALYYPDM